MPLAAASSSAGILAFVNRIVRVIDSRSSVGGFETNGQVLPLRAEVDCFVLSQNFRAQVLKWKNSQMKVTEGVDRSL